MKFHNDLIMELPEFVPESFCKHIIEKFESDSRAEPGTIDYRGMSELSDYKQSIELSIPYLANSGWGKENDIIISYIRSAVDLYNKYLREEYKDGLFEPILKNVDKNDIFFKTYCTIHKQTKQCGYVWHYDYTKNPDSYLFGILYLHTIEPHGGETEFINGRKIKAECGKIMLCPANWTYAHRGNHFQTKYKYIVAFYVLTNKLIS